MSIARHIQTGLQLPTFIVDGYLEDLAQEDLFVRPAPGANHIAWQLGHLITSEHQMINMVCPDAMPPLPEGFAEAYTKETAGLDDPEAFHSKEEYLRVRDEQRKAMLAALEKLSDEELESPTPEKLQRFATTVGTLFSGLGIHWTMHAGQWAVIRRQLGRPPLF